MLAFDTHPVAASLIGRQDDLEVSVVVDLKFVDQRIARRNDAIHRLQPDIAGRSPVAMQPVTLPAAQSRSGVQAIWALHPPGDGVIHAGGLDTQNRVGVDPQSSVDTGCQQNQQVPHSRRQINLVPADRVRFDERRRAREPLGQVRPRMRQVRLIAVSAV
jgi:hypothetical protein